MEHKENSTLTPKLLFLRTQSSAHSHEEQSNGNAYLYILIVMSFYGIFLFGIMLGYFRSKRREKRRTNIFTRLVHEEEQREWGALPKKNSITFQPAVPELPAVHVPFCGNHVPFCGNHGNHFRHLHYEGVPQSPLACTVCTEHSSVSSQCSSADTRFAIEEETDSCEAEGSEEQVKDSAEDSG
ncbi:potassium voltage-gated channel subfamily E member 4 [Gymnodraco acuticeps]|uniref:Potassium voltage-gated channel subfamily E member 4 n=1 Tax=Gymnodraco acuticeps TaxID=8218 RepID=A0A6P8SUL4_GYMAC|nr:potassium voltage-gated channel subfamily E member 4 [Gymnodraco acuticeps]